MGWPISRYTSASCGCHVATPPTYRLNIQKAAAISTVSWISLSVAPCFFAFSTSSVVTCLPPLRTLPAIPSNVFSLSEISVASKFCLIQDQLADLLRRPSSSNLRPNSGDQPPVHTKTCPVPVGEGFGPNAMTRDCFQADQTRRAITWKSLSKKPSLGRGHRRFRTASCCRSTRFSKTRCPRLRKSRIRAPIQRKSRLKWHGVTPA
jgi:hypothetical protein